MRSMANVTCAVCTNNAAGYMWLDVRLGAALVLIHRIGAAHGCDLEEALCRFWAAGFVFIHNLVQGALS